MAEIKNGKLQLPNVTLLAMTSVRVRETIKAMQYSMRGIDFADAVLVTHRKPLFLPKEITYKHIGSPWPLPKEGDTTTYRDIHGNICRVGNSVSIRSKRLMDFPKKENVPWVGEELNGVVYYNEDGFICCKIRHLLEAAGMRIAPLEVAKYFGHENMIPEIEGITPFLFHKWMGTNAQYPDFRRKK